MTTEDDDLERDPELRYLDAALAERFRRRGGVTGGEPEARQQSPAALRRGRHGQGAGAWVGAAAVLGAGLLVVWLATRNGGPERQLPAQDSRPESRGSQPQEVESVRAKDEADFARLLAQARFAVVVATYSTVALQPLSKGPFQEIVVSQHKPLDLLGKIVTRERKLVPAGWEWPHVIRLQLEGKPAVQCAFDLVGGGRRLGVQGLGDYRVEPEELAQWRELLLEAEWRTQRLQGFVANGEQLRRSDEGAMPAETKKLRCAGLRDADLAGLERFTALEELDLSPSATTLGPDALLSLPRLQHLRTLRIDGLGASPSAILRANVLPELRALSWRRGRLEPKGAAMCESSRTLRHLDLAGHQNLGGFELHSMLSALGGDRFETLDLTGCPAVQDADLGWLEDNMPRCAIKR